MYNLQSKDIFHAYMCHSPIEICKININNIRTVQSFNTRNEHTSIIKEKSDQVEVVSLRTNETKGAARAKRGLITYHSAHRSIKSC